MNKEAYKAGVEQALVDVGLLGITKQAGVAGSASPLLLKLKALLGSGKEFGAKGIQRLKEFDDPIAAGLADEAPGALQRMGLREGFSPGIRALIGGAAGAGGTALGGGDIGDILLGTGAGAGVGASARGLRRMLRNIGGSPLPKGMYEPFI